MNNNNNKYKNAAAPAHGSSGLVCARPRCENNLIYISSARDRRDGALRTDPSIKKFRAPFVISADRPTPNGSPSHVDASQRIRLFSPLLLLLFPNNWHPRFYFFFIRLFDLFRRRRRRRERYLECVFIFSSSRPTIL